VQFQEAVRLSHFRRDFFTYLQDLHGQDEGFQSWLKEYHGTDIARVVTLLAKDALSQLFPLAITATPAYTV
jgi:hypothetical protein